MSLTSGISLAPLEVKLKADISGFKSDMEKARVAGVTEADKISKSLESTAKTGERLSGVGGNLTKFVSLPLAGVAVVAGKMAMDFSKSMGMVSTLLDGTAEQVKDRTAELSKSVLNVSKDTGVAAKDISGGLYEVISAYGDTADSAKILEVAAKGAKASGATTTDTIRLLSSVTKGYGDTSFEANQKVADLAFLTAKLGQTTFPELAGSIGQVVPLCENLKVSQEELFGVMATATGVTGNASEVTTQLKGVLQSLMSPTKDMTELMDGLGYANGQAMMESLGFQGALNTIVKAAEDSGKPLQDYIGSIEGQVLALALAGAQSENLTEKTKAMMSATGAATEAFEKSQDNVGAKFETAMNKISVSLIQLGDAAAPTLEKVADMISDVADWFSSLSDEQQENIVKWGGVAMAAGPVLKILGDGVQTFSKFKPLLSGLSKGLETLSGAGKTVSETLPKAATVASDLGEVVGGLPDLVKPAAKGVSDLAEAGGSAAKALPNATKMIEGVGYAVDGIPKVAAPAAESLTTVAGSAGKAATAVGGGSGLSGVLSGVLGSSLATAAVGVGAFAAAVGGIAVGVVEAYKQINADVVPEIDLFSETLDKSTERMAASSGYGAALAASNTVKISEATKQAVGAYMELDQSAQRSLFNLQMNGSVITGQIASDLTTQFSNMGGMITQKLDLDYQNNMGILNNFFTTSSTLTTEQQTAALSRLTQNYEQQKLTTQDAQNQMIAIISTASSQNRALTQEEHDQINSLREGMRTNAIGTLSATEAESAVILGRIKDHDGRMTAEMASEHVRQLEEQRVKTVDTANMEYEQRMAVARALRADGTAESAQLADSIEQDAARQRDAQIEGAQRAKDEGLSVLKGAYNDLESNVDINTGAIKTHWNKVQDWWSELWFPDKEANIITNHIDNYSTNGAIAGGGGGGGGGGSWPNYNGLDYVPHDGYLAYLHKGERVQTAEENKARIQGSGASGGDSGILITGNTFQIRNEQDAERVAQELWKLKMKKTRGG